MGPVPSVRPIPPVGQTEAMTHLGAVTVRAPGLVLVEPLQCWLLNARSGLGHPFSAPAVPPRTKYRWKKMKTRATGMVISRAAAIVSGNC